MAWEMLKATGKLFYELFDFEVVDPLKSFAAVLAEPSTLLLFGLGMVLFRIKKW